MAENTITIDGVDVTADGAEAICDQLRDSVFPSTNSGSGGSGGGGTVYAALLNQTGTAVPVATELQNGIGEIVWSRSGIGTYRATLAGAFPADKTMLFIQQSNENYSGKTYCNRLNDNEILVQTVDESGATVDEDLINRSFKIEIYP